MAGINTIYFGELLDWHNYPSGGLNGQSGFTTYAGSALAQLDTSRGKRASLYHISGTPSKWGNGANGFNAFSVLQPVLDAAHAAGALPYVDWSPWDWANPTANFSFRPAAVAAGNWDTQLNTWFTAAAAWGKQVLVRPGWEQQLTWAPWMHSVSGSWDLVAAGVSVGWGGPSTAGGWTNTIATYKAMWAHIRALRDANGASNVKMCWVPNRHASSETATTYALIAPPVSQIDWLGLDTYPDFGQSLGNALLGAGGMSYLSNNYADLCALDAVKPIIVGEFAWAQSNNTDVTVSSVTSTTSVITVVVSSAPGSDTWSAGGNAIALAGETPSAYNREWDIASVSGTGPFTITINSTANPGTASVNGTARFVNRVQTASLITTDLETTIPTSCPRVQALVEYHVVDGWPDDHHPIDVDGGRTGSVSFVAYKNAIGNAHFLAGQQMATDTSTKLWVPFQDQAVTPDSSTGRATAFERYLAVLRSTRGLELLLPLTEASGASTVADVSGKSRTGTVVGTPGLGGANVIPALPNWSSPSWPGASGNNIQVADNAAFSLATGPMSWEFSLLLTATPTTSFAIMSKYQTSGSQAEWLIGFYIGNPGLACAAYTAAGVLISSTNDVTWPSLNVPHHYIITHNPSLPTGRWRRFEDGVDSGLGGTPSPSGTYTHGTTPVYIGQTPDAALLWPAPSGVRYGPCAIYSTVLSPESAAEHYAAWTAAPVITAVTAV